jgi:DNA repair exonuclease SbcCD ATPase subunit
LLNEVTGIDLIDTIEERAKNEYLELKWAKEKDDTTSERMEKLLAEYEPAVETANAIKNELTEYEGYSEKTRVKVEELSERVSQIEKAYLAAEETRIEQAQRIGQINQIDQAIQRLRVPTTPVTVEELSVLYKALQERTADYQAWKAADDELKRLEGDLGAIQGELDALPAGDLPEVDLQELKEAKDAHDQRHLEAKQRVKAATKALESTVCPTCHRPYESIDLSALQAELDEAKQAYEAVEEAWKAFKAYHDETLEEVARLREVQRTRDRLEEKRSKLQAEASACQVPESVDFDEVSGMQEDYARRYQKYQEEQSIQTELTRLYSERERLVTEVHELGEAKGPDDAEIIKAREDLAAARKERESITDRVSTLRASQAQYDSYLQQAEVALKAMQDEIDDVKAKAERANKIDALVKYLRKNRDAYSAAIWDQLLAYTSSFISEATGGDTTGLSRSVTGEFMYVENGYDFPADLCSGMQGAILGVSLKLALGAALGTQGELLLIDEATAGGTDENSLLFSQLLAGLNSQVIMVTHRQSDAVCANHVVKL